MINQISPNKNVSSYAFASLTFTSLQIPSFLSLLSTCSVQMPYATFHPKSHDNDSTRQSVLEQLLQALRNAMIVSNVWKSGVDTAVSLSSLSSNISMGTDYGKRRNERNLEKCFGKVERKSTKIMMENNVPPETFSLSSCNRWNYKIPYTTGRGLTSGTNMYLNNRLIRAIRSKNIPLSLELFQSTLNKEESYSDEMNQLHMVTYVRLVNLLCQRSHGAKHLHHAVHVFQEYLHQHANVHGKSHSDILERDTQTVTRTSKMLMRVAGCISNASWNDMTFNMFDRYCKLMIGILIHELPRQPYGEQFVPVYMECLMTQKLASPKAVKSRVSDLWMVGRRWTFGSSENAEEGSERESKNYSFNTKKWTGIILLLYQKVLNCSTYRRQEVFPFGELLHVLVRKGVVPPPSIVLNIFQNEYPYTNMRTVHRLLKITMYLQRAKPPIFPDYRLDIGTIEHVSSMAARYVSPEMIFLLWNYMDLMVHYDDSIREYYRPTEGMYESSVKVFLNTNNSDHVALNILSEMEEREYIPSRTLIRSTGKVIGRSRGRLDNAYYLLLNNIEGDVHQHGSTMDDNKRNSRSTRRAAGKFSTASLNCIVSACAQSGWVEMAFGMLHDYEMHGCRLDGDTYSFLLEGVAERLEMKKSNNPDAHRNDATSTIHYTDREMLEHAEAIIKAARGSGYGTNSHLVHQYIRILCAIGCTDEAIQFLQVLANDDNKEAYHALSMDTFAMLAISCAKSGCSNGLHNSVRLSLEAGYEGFSWNIVEQLEQYRVGIMFQEILVWYKS